MFFSDSKTIATDKGKPVVRQGRKAMILQYLTEERQAAEGDRRPREPTRVCPKCNLPRAPLRVTLQRWSFPQKSTLQFYLKLGASDLHSHSFPFNSSSTVPA